MRKLITLSGAVVASALFFAVPSKAAGFQSAIDLQNLTHSQVTDTSPELVGFKHRSFRGKFHRGHRFRGHSRFHHGGFGKRRFVNRGFHHRNFGHSRRLNRFGIHRSFKRGFHGNYRYRHSGR